MSLFFSTFKSQFWIEFRLQFAIIAFIYLMHSTDNNKQTFYLCELNIHSPFPIEKWKCNPCFFSLCFRYRKPKAKSITIELMQIFKTDNLVANRHPETHWGIKKYTNKNLFWMNWIWFFECNFQWIENRSSKNRHLSVIMVSFASFKCTFCVLKFYNWCQF